MHDSIVHEALILTFQALQYCHNIIRNQVSMLTGSLESLVWARMIVLVLLLVAWRPLLPLPFAPESIPQKRALVPVGIPTIFPSVFAVRSEEVNARDSLASRAQLEARLVTAHPWSPNLVETTSTHRERRSVPCHQ